MAGFKVTPEDRISATLEILMRWILVALLLLCALPLAAQSLGDVARAQRDDPKHAKSKHVITNDDLPVAQMQPSPTATISTASLKPIDRGQQVDVERAREQQRHVTELNQRLQLLQNEVNDLDRQRTSVRNSNVYGDPNRIQKNDEIRSLNEQIESKSRELAAARNELTEAMERANRTTVLK